MAIIKHDMIFEENLLVKGDMEIHGDLTVMGTLTIINTEERTFYKDYEIKTKWDLFKALIGLT